MIFVNKQNIDIEGDFEEVIAEIAYIIMSVYEIKEIPLKDKTLKVLLEEIINISYKEYKNLNKLKFNNKLWKYLLNIDIEDKKKKL